MSANEWTIPVLSSLAGAMIYAGLSFLLSRWLVPSIQTLRLQEPDLSGIWHADVVNPSGNEQELTMTIHQRGYEISGEIKVVKKIKSSRDTELKTYNVKGDVKHRFVLLIARNVNKQSVGATVFILEVVGGRIMRGLCAWYSITHERIQHTEYEWKRTQSAKPSG